MTAKEQPPAYVQNGRRLDGRRVDELRPITIRPGVLARADGSAYIAWGQNKALVGVYGPREALPQHIQDPTRAIVNMVYRMATFSVPDYKNPRPGRRDIEISKVCSEALARAIFVERFPNTTIDIYAYLFDSYAGTRITALTAASVALADAGIPMRDLVAGVAVGRAGGEIILDVTKAEEDAPDAVDMPIAILPRTEEIVLLQMDGVLSIDEYKKALALGIQGCKKVHAIQVEAFKKYYQSDEGGDNEEAGQAGPEKESEGRAPATPQEVANDFEDAAKRLGGDA